MIAVTHLLCEAVCCAVTVNVIFSLPLVFFLALVVGPLVVGKKGSEVVPPSCCAVRLLEVVTRKRERGLALFYIGKWGDFYTQYVY